MEFLNHHIKLAIFDLDGTLIDSTSLWSEIDSIFFKRRNMEIPFNYGKEIAHLGLLNAAKLTKEKYLPNEEIDDILKEWHDLALEAYQYHINLKENSLEVLEFLKEKGVKIALATANSEELYLPLLKRLNIEKYFSIITDVNSCKDGKNSSEIYDKIAAFFRVNKDETLIFEDMLTAQKTAYKAGYIVIGVYDKNSVVNILDNQKYSHLYIDNFKSFIKQVK